MNYVDAGYAVALATLFVYALTLMLRRRRWERAFRLARAGESPGAPAATTTGAAVADGTTTGVVPGSRP